MRVQISVPSLVISDIVGMVQLVYKILPMHGKLVFGEHVRKPQVNVLERIDILMIQQTTVVVLVDNGKLYLVKVLKTKQLVKIRNDYQIDHKDLIISM